MNTTYIISDFTEKMKKLVGDLKISESNVISNQKHEREAEYHAWLTNIFKDNEIDKLIIPLSLPTDASVINTDGLLLALHIRLNYEFSDQQKKKRLIPIIFLSNLSIENIIIENTFDKDNNPQNLLFTKGIYFSAFDAEEIKETLDKAEPCKEEEYFEKVLSKLNINRKATTGGHDIANAWGCYKLAQITGLREQIFQLESISKHLKQLYAKYLICRNEIFSIEDDDLDLIKCEGKKILFIDDKADEGWGLLLKKVFEETKDNFIYVDSSKYKANDSHKSFKDFEGFYNECKSHKGKDWDLIIMDLRLNPDKEDIDDKIISPKEFSGYKLIDEFLRENEGYQIILLTASNKIWNVNETLNRGAYSYYIKESPEFNYSLSETKKHFDNLKKNALKSFERSYLRDVYKKTLIIKNIKLQPKSTDILKFKDLKLTIKQNLDSAFILAKNDNTLEFALFTYLQTLESYCKFFTYKEKKNTKAIVYKNYDDRKKRENENIIFEKVGNKIRSNYKYEKGYYSFQKNTEENDKQFINYLKEGVEYEDGELELSFALKLAAVLDEQLGSLDGLPKLMEIIFIRNNKIAHTGNFDKSKRKILKEDIQSIFQIIYKLINKSF